MSTPTCSKCSVALQEGFLLDNGQYGLSATKWVEGKPKPSFWQGLSLKGKQQLALVSYRCPRCGLLELYAPAGDTH